MRENNEQDKQAVSWAAATITKHGGKLHSVGADGKPLPFNHWDIETPHGWAAACSVTELCEEAHALIARTRREAAA